MNVKKYIKQIHLWLGITVGFIVSFSGITGALYVWQPELAAITAKEVLRTSDSHTITYKEYLQTAKHLEGVHKDSLVATRFPYRERQTIRLDFKNGHSYYYHPGSGQYLGKNPFTVTFFKTLLQLHRNLCIGTIGKYIIGTSTLIFGFLMLGSGLYLWRHIYKKRWRKGFSLKRKTNSKAFNFNLHKLVGMYGVLPLFIIAITGGYFTYHSTYKALLSGIPAFDIKGASSLSLPEVGTPFHFDDMALELYPHYYITTIQYPTNKKSSYRFRFINSAVIQSGLRKPIDIFTKANKTITKVNSYETFSKSEKITAQMYPIHIGESLGFFNRILVFMCGLLPITLYITGLRFFLFRKKRL